MNWTMSRQIYYSGDGILITHVHRFTVPDLFVYVISNTLAWRYLENVSCK